MSVPTVAASKTKQRGSCACLQHSSQPAIPIHVFATVIVSLSRCTCSQVDPHKAHVLLLQVCSDASMAIEAGKIYSDASNCVMIVTRHTGLCGISPINSIALYVCMCIDPWPSQMPQPLRVPQGPRRAPSSCPSCPGESNDGGGSSPQAYHDDETQ